MVETFVNDLVSVLQETFVSLSDLVPGIGATNLVLIIALLVPIAILFAMRLWSSLDRFLIRRQLSKDFAEMVDFISAKHSEIEGIELYIASYVPPISAECMRALDLSKRLCGAMRNIVLEMSPLINSRTEHELLHAQRLRFTPLLVAPSPLETVQLDMEIPPIPWEEWQTSLSDVLEIVTTEIEASKIKRGEALSDSSSGGAHAARPTSNAA